MHILMTGVTSFTGSWFATALMNAGHTLTAAVRSPHSVYTGLRAERLAMLHGARLVWDAPFGSPPFMDAVRSDRFDLLCHHAAEVKNYKSPNFDALAATAANTRELRSVLEVLRSAGCRRILLTGSVFEANEGTGDTPLRAFSPYGLSKTLTAEVFGYHTAAAGFGLGKFVIPNPFGAFEEPRFTDYLMRCWKDGKQAQVNTPAYVRDNVPVSLLAAAYARFAGTLPLSGFHRLNPSFYVESQGEFAQRFAREMGQRLALDTPLDLVAQSDFPEPARRINTDRLNGADLNWTEAAFWDETAHYYAKRLEIALR